MLRKILIAAEMVGIADERLKHILKENLTNKISAYWTILLIGPPGMFSLHSDPLLSKQ